MPQPARVPHRGQLLAALLLASLACERLHGDDAEKPQQSPRPRWHLRNGSRIGGDVGIEAVTVETRYGSLRIPLSEVVSVRFAPRLSPRDREDLVRALQQLAGDSEDERASAAATLREIGPASLPALRVAIRAAASPLAERVEEIYSDILKRTASISGSDEVLAPLFGHEEDEVVTRRFRVSGRIREDVFRLLSPYGQLEVERADLAAITFDVGRSARAEVSVDAARVVPDNWFRTAVEVQRGDKLSLIASGQMNQPNYGIVCGPEGTTRYSGSTFHNLPMLSLVGKVGRGGKPFSIGRKLRQKATDSGRLYLGIVPFRRNYAAQGTYKVKVSVNP